MKTGGRYYFYHNDHLGTPLKMTDISGAVVWSAKSESFGETLVGVATVENNLRFPGQYYDAETGLHYNWFRYYDPNTGRYLLVDPIGFWDRYSNMYSYVLNDPLIGIDPAGLWTVSFGVEVGGYLGAFGGGGGTAINFGYSENSGLSFSITGTYAGGAMTGIGAGVGGSLTFTNASSVNQLLSNSLMASRGLGPVTITGIAGNGYEGGGFAIGLGGKNIVNPRAAGMVTNTSAIFQYDNGYSIGNTGNDSIWNSKNCD